MGWFLFEKEVSELEARFSSVKNPYLIKFLQGFIKALENEPDYAGHNAATQEVSVQLIEKIQELISTEKDSAASKNSMILAQSMFNNAKALISFFPNEDKKSDLQLLKDFKIELESQTRTKVLLQQSILEKFFEPIILSLRGIDTELKQAATKMMQSGDPNIQDVVLRHLTSEEDKAKVREICKNVTMTNIYESLSSIQDIIKENKIKWGGSSDDNPVSKAYALLVIADQVDRVADKLTLHYDSLEYMDLQTLVEMAQQMAKFKIDVLSNLSPIINEAGFSSLTKKQLEQIKSLKPILALKAIKFDANKFSQAVTDTVKIFLSDGSGNELERVLGYDVASASIDNVDGRRIWIDLINGMIDAMESRLKITSLEQFEKRVSDLAMSYETGSLFNQSKEYSKMQIKELQSKDLKLLIPAIIILALSYVNDSPPQSVDYYAKLAKVDPKELDLVMKMVTHALGASFFATKSIFEMTIEERKEYIKINEDTKDSKIKEMLEIAQNINLHIESDVKAIEKTQDFNNKDIDELMPLLAKYCELLGTKRSVSENQDLIIEHCMYIDLINKIKIRIFDYLTDPERRLDNKTKKTLQLLEIKYNSLPVMVRIFERLNEKIDFRNTNGKGFTTM